MGGTSFGLRCWMLVLSALSALLCFCASVLSLLSNARSMGGSEGSPDMLRHAISERETTGGYWRLLEATEDLMF